MSGVSEKDELLHSSLAVVLKMCNVAPSEKFICLQTFSVVPNQRRGGRRKRGYSSSRQRPEILLNMLQCTEQSPTPLIKSYLIQNVHSAAADKSCTII